MKITGEHLSNLDLVTTASTDIILSKEDIIRGKDKLKNKTTEAFYVVEFLEDDESPEPIGIEEAPKSKVHVE